MADETTEVHVICGPYIGNRLTMPAAEATSAINNHWAIDPYAPLDEEPHDPLSEQERQEAYEASMTWAKAQWAPPEEPPPPPEGGEGGVEREGRARREATPPEMHKRDMTPHGRGEYETKTAKPK